MHGMLESLCQAKVWVELKNFERNEWNEENAKSERCTAVDAASLGRQVYGRRWSMLFNEMNRANDLREVFSKYMNRETPQNE